jgi:hypothetical protein
VKTGVKQRGGDEMRLHLNTTFLRSVTPCIKYEFNVSNAHITSIVMLRFPPGFTLVSCLPYSSIFKKEAIYFSETSVYYERNTRLCNTEILLCCDDVQNYRVFIL